MHVKDIEQVEHAHKPYCQRLAILVFIFRCVVVLWVYGVGAHTLLALALL